MARLLKCYGYCNEKYEKENLVEFNNKRYCKPCATRKKKETEDRNTLYKTIKTVYKVPYPTGQMLAQIKQFTEEREYTLEGITKTICYYLKVLKKEPLTRFGLSFVPYNYDSAVKYYNELDEKRKQNNDISNNVVVIKIKPKFNNNNEDLIKKRFISMEDCLDDR